MLPALNHVNGMMTLVDQETEVITIRNGKFVCEVDIIQILSHFSHPQCCVSVYVHKFKGMHFGMATPLSVKGIIVTTLSLGQ